MEILIPPVSSKVTIAEQVSPVLNNSMSRTRSFPPWQPSKCCLSTVWNAKK